MDCNDSIVIECLGVIIGVVVLIMRTKELEPLVIFSGDGSDLRGKFTHNFAAIIHRTQKTSNPFSCPRIVICSAVLLREGNVCLILSAPLRLE